MISTLVLCILTADPGPFYAAELVFPLNEEHNHAPGIVECPNGDLLVSWYRGSGERSADDVRVLGARKKKGKDVWSEPVVWADTPEFPDCNTALILDGKQQLWLFYPTIIANSWESCLTNFKVSADFEHEDPPVWNREGILFLKPDDFSEEARKVFDRDVGFIEWALPEKQKEKVKQLRDRLGDKLYQRLGWQPRCKPTILPSGRMLLPLYSDTFSMSMMAISDDEGKTWFAGKPMLGFGNIQPAVLRKQDGTLVAYMRENGPRNRIRVAESQDDGESWGDVLMTDLPNPGSGVDGLRLANGHWILIYNDTTKGRNRLAISLSEDEGKTWPVTRHLEDQESGSYHYPAVTQGTDDTIHVVYSYFVSDGKSMKHAALNEAWIRETP